MAAKFSWLGSIATILGFFWIQLRIEQLARDWSQTLLFLLTLVAEVYLIWLWNSQNI